MNYILISGNLPNNITKKTLITCVRVLSKKFAVNYFNSFISNDFLFENEIWKFIETKRFYLVEDVSTKSFRATT